MTTLKTWLVLLVVSLPASAAFAGTLDGTVMLGGVIMNQDGDRSAVQETYNIYDGFSIDRIHLNAVPVPTDFVTLDLREINLSSRRGDFVYRRPGLFKVSAAVDESRQVFTPDAGVNATRKDWQFGAQYTPVKWLGLSGSFNYQTREGSRISYPIGTMSVLGSSYDNALKIGQVTAEAHKGRVGGAVTYNVSNFSDDRNGDADRTGQVVSARLYAPCRFYDKLTHLVRGSYGVRKLSDGDIETKLSSFEYTGVVAPWRVFEFRYNYDASRVDDQSTDLKTDRFQNNFDATFFHRFGQVSGGYGYEINDDDQTLTHYHSWRAGTVFRWAKFVTAKVNYAGRNKKDEEGLTLLKDIESNQFRARLQVQPIDALAVGGGYTERHREFPDVGVKADGDVSEGFARYTLKGWGSVSADYSHTTDTFEDLMGDFYTRSEVVTGRADIERIEDVRLSGGVTYLDIRGDLKIEKLMVFAEGSYTFQHTYRIEAKYNVYNYDDYVLVDRYYTANVLRINVGYLFNLK